MAHAGASCRSPAPSRRRCRAARCATCPRHSRGHGPSRAWHRDCRDTACFCVPQFDGGDGAGDLARHEGLAAQRAFMVEQDAVRRMHAIGFAVIDRDPVGIKLGGGIRPARIEGRRLALRHLLHLAVKFRRRGLVEARLLLQPQDADGLQQAQRADAIGIGGIFGRLEADLHMALRGEVVDLVGLRFLHQADQVGGIGHVAVMQEEAGVGPRAGPGTDGRCGRC